MREGKYSSFFEIKIHVFFEFYKDLTKLGVIFTNKKRLCEIQTKVQVENAKINGKIPKCQEGAL